MRCGDENRINGFAVNQGFGRVENLHCFAKFAARPIAGAFNRIGYCCQSRTGNFSCGKIGGVMTAHAAESDNAKTNVVHKKWLLK